MDGKQMIPWAFLHLGAQTTYVTPFTLYFSYYNHHVFYNTKNNKSSKFLAAKVAGFLIPPSYIKIIDDVSECALADAGNQCKIIKGNHCTLLGVLMKGVSAPNGASFQE